jgi:iron complex transport system substrate-binding protein
MGNETTDSGLRRILIASILVLAGCLGTPFPALAQPGRVVSINLCTDQLLLMLAEQEQIASVSYLALEPHSSFMAAEAKAYPVNHAKAEEILALKPDLVLAGAFSDRPLVMLLQKLGYRVERFPLASDIDSLERVASQRPRTRPKAAFYQPNGYTSGRNTLQDSALQLAGWRNLAVEQGIEGYGSIDLERLLMAGPDRLFTSHYIPGTHSRAEKQLAHPALHRAMNGREIIDIEYRYWICGGPMIADAVEKLHRSLPR